MKLALIPARGGSKRIPRKNIKDFLGKPILYYSVTAAIQSRLFDKVIVSTDDEEIAKLAVAAGAEVPFLRSPENSGDQASTASVIEEILEKFSILGLNFEYVCCLYPTAPFVTGETLQKAWNTLNQTKADCVFPVLKFDYPPQRALKIEGERVSMLHPENMLARSQDLMPLYHDAGQFYFLKVSSFSSQKRILMTDSAPLILSPSQAQDIDTHEDWQIAEIKYRSLHGMI